MSTARPTSYDELIDVLESLPVLVREKRRRLGLSIRAAAREAGIPFSSLDRFERRQTAPDLMRTVLPLLRWVSR